MAEYNHYSTENTRTAGNHAKLYKSVQAWKTKKTAVPQETRIAKQQIVGNLEKAAKGQIGTFDVQLETSMAYADPGTKIENQTQETDSGYQFEDVIDVINPLHHLPIVGMVYRGLTGDTLHPMSQIIGGALYGGPVGAVTGTINAVSQVQTGKDLSDHALGFAGFGPENSPTVDKNNPEAQLDSVANTQNPLSEIPGNALSFVNLSEPNKAYQHIKIAEGRTAGSMAVKKMASYRQTVNTQPLVNNPLPADLDNLPAKERITTVKLSSMPPRKDT